MVTPRVFYRAKSLKTKAGWRGQIHRGGTRLHSPRFDTEHEAAQWMLQHLGAQQPVQKREPVEQPAEQPPGKVSRRLTTKSGPIRRSSTVATEQAVMARVRAAEAKVQELQEELEQTKGKLALSEQKAAAIAARCQELEDQNDWFHAASRAKVNPPTTLVRRSAPQGCREGRLCRV